MTPLRRRMINDMTVRGLAENTRKSYLNSVSGARASPPARVPVWVEPGIFGLLGGALSAQRSTRQRSREPPAAAPARRPLVRAARPAHSNATESPANSRHGSRVLGTKRGWHHRKMRLCTAAGPGRCIPDPTTGPAGAGLSRATPPRAGGRGAGGVRPRPPCRRSASRRAGLPRPGATEPTSRAAR